MILEDLGLDDEKVEEIVEINVDKPVETSEYTSPNKAEAVQEDKQVEETQNAKPALLEDDEIQKCKESNEPKIL
jgi:hypothetical protein